MIIIALHVGPDSSMFEEKMKVKWDFEKWITELLFTTLSISATTWARLSKRRRRVPFSFSSFLSFMLLEGLMELGANFNIITSFISVTHPAAEPSRAKLSRAPHGCGKNVGRQTCTAGREAPECSIHKSLPGNRRCPPKCAGKEEALGMERSEMHWPSTDNTGQNAVMEPHKGPLQTKRSILKHAQRSLGRMRVATNWHKGKK